MKQILFVFAWLLVAIPSFGTTYYVGLSGNDANGCVTAQSSTAGSRKRTIANMIANCAKVSGDIAIIGTGQYNESLISTMPAGVTLKAETANGAVIKMPAGEYVYVTNANVTFDGIFFDASVSDAGAIDVEADNFTLKNGTVAHTIGPFTSNVGCVYIGPPANGALIQNMLIFDCNTSSDASHHSVHGVYLAGSTATLESSIIHNVHQGFTVHIYSGSGTPTANIVRNNIIYDQASTGAGDAACILAAVGNDHLIYNNVMYSCEDGIRIQGSTNNIQAYNNTAMLNSQWGIQVIATGGTPTNAIIRNNIAFSNSSGSISNGGTGTSCSFNLAPSPSGVTCTSNQTANPNVVSTGSGTEDFNLTIASTAAIGNATQLNSTFTTDKNGVVRGTTWDIGAYEFNSGGVGAPLRTTSIQGRVVVR